MTNTGVVSSTEKPTSTRMLAVRSSAPIAASGGGLLRPGQEVRPRVLARGRGGEGVDRRPCLAVHPLRHRDLHGDEQVAGLLAMLARDAAPLDPQRAPARRARGPPDPDGGAVRGGYLDLGPERGLREGDGH